MMGEITRMAGCNLSALPQCRRVVEAGLVEVAARAGVRVASARPRVDVWIGPREWRAFAAAARSCRTEDDGTRDPFLWLEAVLSELTARHREDDPAVLIFATLAVSADPGPDPVQELTEVRTRG